MDPLRVCLAIGPVAAYLLLIGAINLFRRPLLINGGRDAAALVAALSGLIVIGPLEMIFPAEVTLYYGEAVWLMLLGLYVTCAALWLLSLRPRLVIYNISVDKLRPILAEVVDRFDADARWAGDCLVLPAVGVQLYVDGFSALCNVSLVAAGGRQSRAGWRRMESGLKSVLAGERTARNPQGIVLIGLGLLLTASIVFVIAQNPGAVAQSLMDIVLAVLRLWGKSP